MSRYRFAIDNVRFQNRCLWVLVAVLVILQGYAFHALDRARQDLPPLHIPPDLRFGAVVEVGDVPAPSLYAFAGYIFQQINRWDRNGEDDYGRNIFRLQAYLTPKFRAELEADLTLRAKRGELRDRTRVLHPMPGQAFEAWRVEVIGGGRWLVWLDAAIEESVKGMGVKHARLRYPLEVVLYDVDPEQNPWGLALDGYGASGPERLSQEALAATATHRVVPEASRP